MFGLFKGKRSDAARSTAVSPRDARARAESGQILLVDVREAGEWAQMHIPGAVHAPLSDLAQHLERLPDDRPLIFYCRSGARSRRAIQICQQLRLPHDTDIAGGIVAWRAAGLPIES